MYFVGSLRDRRSKKVSPRKVGRVFCNRSRAGNLFNFWPSSRSVKSLLLDNFSLRSQQMVSNDFLYPYKYPEFHLRKIWLQFWATRHFPDGDGHYGGKLKLSRSMACNRHSSLTQTDSIVAYASLGSKLQKVQGKPRLHVSLSPN